MKMIRKYRVAGYVKLAKLWERAAEEAIEYHHEYYETKFQDDPQMELYDVYIDITGQKRLKKRTQMVRLLTDCIDGKVDVIATQTRAYLAANSRELFYLIHLLLAMEHPVEIMTEDINYHIDTIENADGQREDLIKMTKDYISLNPQDYKDWKAEIYNTIIDCRKKVVNTE